MNGETAYPGSLAIYGVLGQAVIQTSNAFPLTNYVWRIRSCSDTRGQLALNETEGIQAGRVDSNWVIASSL
ncbi:hypothetical protein BH20CHL4_BH20CHL4_00400 [soil metagenome]